ncbi:MAG: TonB-dependent receptor plug domain-containing protein, partial [Gammaproteobacteria bacterium]
MTIITQLTDNFQKLWIAIRLSVTCTFVAGAMVFSAAVQAQSANSQQADSMSDLEEGIEELVVTGTLIRGTPIDGANSVTVIDRSELEVQGTPSVIDIVRNLGIANGNLGETNQFQANGAEGVASVNIRGLGNERTLLLLNGRRLPYVGYGFANFSNLNAIPAIALQRLEVLKEGAAATYGSDAVAGVANVITRSKFDGFELSANLNMIDGSDGDTQLGLIWGNEYSPGSNLMVSFGLYERSELPTVERDWAVSGPATGGTGTNTPAIGTSGIPNPGLFYT